MPSNLFSFKNLLALVFTLWFGYVAWGALDFPYLARVQPLYAGTFLFILGIVNLIQQVRRTNESGNDEGAGLGDLSTQWDLSFGLVWRRFFYYLSMLLVLYAFFWIIGYPLTMILFIFLFYLFKTEASWKAALVAALCGLAFLALASHVLSMQWPEGWIRLPWPLG